MRLIDVDELKKVIHCAYSDDLDILEKIDLQPTTYDIDKVVEKLKQEIVWVDHWGKRYCSQQNAIEIVKGRWEEWILMRL